MQRFGDACAIFNVENKKALVTGATQGMGKAMAACLLENGCDVVAVGRDVSKALDLVELAEENGRECLLISCDVTEEAAVAHMVSQAVHAFDRIDILINSAGGGEFAFLNDMTVDAWDRVMSKTLKSKFLVIREVAAIMKANRYGKILSISSMSSIFGSSGCGNAAYCAAMGGVNALMRQIACELAPYGITVNTIAPTFMNTPYVARDLKANKNFEESLRRKIPLGRIGEVEDLVGLMLLLVSDASAFMTGLTVPLDGGILARGSDNEEFSISP